MDILKVSDLHEAIARVFASWEAYQSAISRFEIDGVPDERHDRYVLDHVDFAGDRYGTRLLANLEIRDAKVWILTDNTEEGIATELFAEGVPKQQIVLGFYPRAVREAGEYAVVWFFSIAISINWPTRVWSIDSKGASGRNYSSSVNGSPDAIVTRMPSFVSTSCSRLASSS